MVLRGVLLNWFRPYLDNRKQTVHLKLLQSNKIANWHNVEQGVPQGSILGPILFLVYILMILINKISDVKMFADDTSILITGNNNQGELLHRLKNVLNHMSKWFQAKRLTLNPTKTEVLTCTSAKLHNALNLTYVDHLMEVETMKFLGLQLDNQITWKKHSTFAQDTKFCLLPHEVIIL